MKNTESYDIVVNGQLYYCAYTCKAVEAVKADAIARLGESAKIEVYKHVVIPYEPAADNDK